MAIGLAPAIACASMHTAEIVTTLGEECTPAVKAAINTSIDMVLQELESGGCAG